LNGGKNIGEVVPGDFSGKERLSRLEECITRGSKAVWSWTRKRQSSYPSQ
jgi:hypothetical protein